MSTSTLSLSEAVARTHPDGLPDADIDAEAAVLDRLAALTEVFGPWKAALLLFGAVGDGR